MSKAANIVGEQPSEWGKQRSSSLAAANVGGLCIDTAADTAKKMPAALRVES
jgi:hypothetical protein